MKKTAWIAALALPGILSACSSTPNCLKTQRYTDAQSLPTLAAPPGLAVPKTDDDLVVPKVDDGPVAAFKKAPEGTEADNPRARCLTTPPPLSS